MRTDRSGQKRAAGSVASGVMRETCQQHEAYGQDCNAKFLAKVSRSSTSVQNVSDIPL
jgi:hypothetical protein